LWLLWPPTPFPVTGNHSRQEAEQQRSILTQTSLSPTRVRAVVSRFLLSQVGSVFAAGTPEPDSTARLWRVPILYHPPDFTGDEVG
jgi:hypothetical protein